MSGNGASARVSEARGARGFWLGGAALVLVAVVMRVNNAIRFDPGWGFDGGANWDYIVRLRQSWALPAPDAFWSSYHPPLFYYVAGAAARVLEPFGKLTSVAGIRLVSAALGMLAIAYGVRLIRRADPEDPGRAFMALALMLFLPAQIYMSAMLSPEIMVASFTTLLVAAVAAEQVGEGRGPGSSLVYMAGLGVLGGLAFLSKLTGCLAIGAAGLAILLTGWRRGELPKAAVDALVLGSVAALVGGWFYARNLIGWGYLYPHALDVHEIMFTMPPGTRGMVDYFYVPLALFRDPQALAPDLVHSVWGTTYVTMWFDGHRHFLARSGDLLATAGGVILALALLPTSAFVVGVGRGLRRAWARIDGPDTPLLLLLFVTLAGYVAFTWRNPWFVTLKASFLLGLTLPFAYYASEVLSAWTRRSTALSVLVWSGLGSLLLCIVAVFTYGLVFSNPGPPGIEWTRVPALR
jgi:hypothetical protein